MRFLFGKILWTFLVSIGITGCARREFADLAFRNGTVYTMETDSPNAVAAAVKGGKISYVGSEAGLKAFLGPNTRIVDLNGGSLLPGFHDAHVHIVQGGLGLVSCDLSEDSTAEATLAHIQRCADQNKGSGWLNGRGWGLGLFPNANPTRQQLDSVVQDRPAFFMAADGHSGWVNSKALQAAGIDAKTRNPAGGRIERDSSGVPSGTLRDAAVGLLLRVMPPPDVGNMERAILRAVERANAAGITSVHEANAQESMMIAYENVRKRGALNVRVTAAAGVAPSLTSVGAIPAEIERLERLRGQYNQPGFRLTGVKLPLDGALEEETAALLEPYIGGKESGLTILSPEIVRPMVMELDRRHFQIHVHAVGDRATRLALDSIQAAREANGPNGPMHQIAHLELVDPADLPRFGLLRVAANIQGLWAYRDPEVTELVEPVIGPQRSARLYPIGSLNRAGAFLVGGSDWSVTALDPLAAIQTAITRRDPEAGAGPAWLPEQVVDLNTMLKAYTINPATLHGESEEVGTVRVGKVADLVVLSKDIGKIPAAQISASQVSYTFLEGKQVFPLLAK